jgi:hypothetical protein
LRNRRAVRVHEFAGARTAERVGELVELPRQPAVAVFTAEQAPRARGPADYARRWRAAREFTVTDAPHRGVCDRCPTGGGLCWWPLEMTGREAPDGLF